MNFAVQFSWGIATGNISPEMMGQLNNMFGGMLGMLFGWMFVIALVIWLVVAIFMIISRWRVFEKAGLPGRGIFIPFYNRYLMFKLGGRSGWNFLWILFPPVFVILMIINYFKIAVRFGKPAIYGLGIWFIKIVFIPILAFDKSVYTPLKKK